jgi:hypothetical protein
MAKSTVAVAALLTVTAAGAGGYYYLQTKDPGDQPEQLAQAVPEQAYAVGYIATDSKIWSKFDRFGSPTVKQLMDRSIQKMQTDLVGDINYQKDVQPWLGNVMLASFTTGSKTDTSQTATSDRPAVLAVSKVKDKISAFNFLNKLKGKSKTPATETDYKGAKIWSVSGKEPYHVASLDDWLVGSSDRSAVEKSIDTIKGAASFSQKNGNQFFASGKLNIPNPISSIYIDFPRMAKAVANSSNKFDASQLAQFSQVQTFVAGTGIDDQGIRAKSLTQMTPNSVKIPAKTGKVLANFPEDSLLVLNGTGLKNIWTEGVKQFDSDPKAKAALADVRKAFRNQTKLDLDKDLFGWLDGEYAIGLFPQKSGFLGSLTGTGVTAVFENTDKQSSEKSLDAVIKGLVAGNAPISAAKSKSGKAINNIASPFGGIVMSYGELDDKSVFLSTKEIAISEPLTKGAEFQKIVGNLSQSDQGLVYLNFQQVAAMLESEPLKEQAASIPADYLSLLKSIKGLAIGNKIAGDTYETEGILMLKPAK